jgi:photoactive yellow protein
MTTMDSTAARTAEFLRGAHSLGEEELDRLPFGMIQLDRDATVLRYNQTESELTRVAKGDAVGRNFFDEVAPCTKVQEFHGRFLEGVEAKRLYAPFNYEFKFRDGRRKDVVITMFYSHGTDTVWVLVQRP